MSLSAGNLTVTLLALMLLLIAAHAGAYVFVRFRQPRVIGEILGGLLLGPTVLGAVFPTAQALLFTQNASAAVVLDACYQLGLLLMMFGAGTEIRSAYLPDERRTIAAVTALGMVIPFVVGLAFVSTLGGEHLIGVAQNRGAFVLVFSLAIAVTSIPVISRIMSDLGVLDTPFARIVLTVAVVEDVIVYIILAIAIGLVVPVHGDAFGVPSLIGLTPGSAVGIAYHTFVTMAFLVCGLFLGPSVYRNVRRSRYNLVKRGNPIAFQLSFMLGPTVLASFLGVVPLFGAFVAGIAVGSSGSRRAIEARETIRNFSMAFFIPIYFAIVGLRLDLLRQFSLSFFLLFLAIACIAKASSVWAGARMVGESPVGARNLAVALNARGGPGIVLASVALDAGIIASGFYAVLVLVAVLTSLVAGSWLGHVVRSGQALR
jgi:Kef-type K+ transport system membrane component KefB